LAKIKIVYLSSNDPTDKKVWSGTHYSIYSTLQKHVGDVVPLGPYEPKVAVFIGKVLTGLSQLLFKKRYNYRHSHLLAKAYGNYFNKKINAQKFDLIIAPAASCELAYINTSVPIIYISDSTINLSINYHKALTDLLPFSEKETRTIEKMALEKCTQLVVSSDWAYQSLIKDYHIKETKVKTLAFGANMELLPSREDIEAKKQTNSCKLLFIGVYWESKGGEIAYNCLLELLKLGIDAELTICGCNPPEKFTHPKMNVIPFINKNSDEGMQKMYSLFLNHDFLILPTRFDCTPIVICEAGAFGLPALVANTGGVAGHLKIGKNGYLIDFNDSGKGYADKIAEIFKNKETFNALKLSARQEFEQHLNWNNYGLELKKIVGSILSNG
jgi:glycosyltransferase involved in cell wall biosynthesis